ncbi:DGQHR domain-containing protein [Cupriavidus taiwanensis]|uniref:DGQHR domain-containing protein n=1 Tax=Cupriavidus taiwanensis TaxID=164546 RepID=UPI0039C02CA8
MPNDLNPIAVFEYSQPGGAFYASILPATEIVNRLEIRRRSTNPELGIQRDENLRRVSEIAKYASSENAIFPTPIIVSVRSEDVSIENGFLYFLHNEGSIGHVLDGQHRVLGLRTLSPLELKKYQLLVVFVFDIDVYSEATIFTTINGNQKQVSKSLIYDLFSLNPGRSIEKTCHEIVRSLHDDQESPFFGRIKILGTKMGPQETLSQSAFVDQLAHQVRNVDGPLLKFYKSNEDWVIRKIIANCFVAINETQPDHSDFPEAYFYRTTGFGGVMQALGVLVMVGEQEGDISQSFFRRIMKRFFAQSSPPPQGVGNSAMLEIKSRLLKAAGIESTSAFSI